MNYGLELPPDTKRQITSYLSAFPKGGERYVAIRDAILDELGKIRLNPQLGAPVYGGPLETRRIVRFAVRVADEIENLQFAYKIDDRNKTIVVSGFDKTPNP